MLTRCPADARPAGSDRGQTLAKVASFEGEKIDMAPAPRRAGPFFHLGPMQIERGMAPVDYFHHLCAFLSGGHQPHGVMSGIHDLPPLMDVHKSRERRRRRDPMMKSFNAAWEVSEREFPAASITTYSPVVSMFADCKLSRYERRLRQGTRSFAGLNVQRAPGAGRCAPGLMTPGSQN